MKFDMSAAWRDATAMLSANREVLMIVAGIFFFLPSVALGFAMGAQPEMMLANPEEAQRAMFELYAGWWWLFLIIAVASVVGYLTLLALLRAEGRPTVGEALKTALTGVLPAIGAYLLFAIAAAILFGVLAVLARASGSEAVGAVAALIIVLLLLYASVRLSLSGPVIAIDKVMNPVAVLRRSWRLTKGNAWRLFMFFLLLLIVYFVVSIVVGVIVGVLTVAFGESPALIVNAVLSGFVSAVVTTIFVAVLAAVHRQLSGSAPQGLPQTFG